MRRSVFLALLLSTAALLLLHFFLQTRSSHQAPPPPAPSALLSPPQAKGLRESCRGKPSLDPTRLDPHPLDRVVFEVFPPQGPRLCHVYGDSGHALNEVRCDPEKEALQGMALVGSERGDAPLLGGLEGVFRLDGALAAPTPSGRASTERLFVTSSGAIAKLRDPLMGQRSGALWSKEKITRETDAPSSAFFLAGSLVWEAEGKLVARKVLGEEPGFGPEQQVAAEVGLGAGRWRACRSGAGWALVAPVFPEAHPADPSKFRIFWVNERGWSPPAEVEVEGIAGDAWALTCGPREVRIGWEQVRGAPPGERPLRVLRCAEGRCSREQGVVRNLGMPQGMGGGLVLIPVGSGAALLWNEGASLRGKIAPVEKLGDAPEQLLVDEAIDLQASEVIGREDAALVMVRPRGGAFYAYPFRVGDGQIKALGCGKEP